MLAWEAFATQLQLPVAPIAATEVVIRLVATLEIENIPAASAVGMGRPMAFATTSPAALVTGMARVSVRQTMPRPMAVAVTGALAATVAAAKSM